MKQSLAVFEDIVPFLRSSDDFSGSKRAKLLEYFDNPKKLVLAELRY